MADADDFQKMLVDSLPRLRAYAITLTRDRSQAEDLVQQTAMQALRARTQFQMGTNFTGWIYRILRNNYISSKRRSNRAPVCMDDMPEDTFSRGGDQEDKVLTREVVKAMDKLQDSQREVLILICAGGMSYEEAAEALQCSVGTVKSRLWRARRQMEELILGKSAPEEVEERPAKEQRPKAEIEHRAQ
jgi:RNA polymerase sigma-70 factor (ECF subfamily)